MRALMLIHASVVLGAVAGCDPKVPLPPTGPLAKGPPSVAAIRLPEPDSLGGISGCVRFGGTPPPRAPIEMSDPVCAACQTDPVLEETIVVGNDGGLKNVVAWVSKGLDPAFVWPVPGSPAVLTQAGCIYRPHVLTMRARQPLEVRNDDDTTHNFHTFPRENDPDNFSQGPRQVDVLTTTSRHKTFVEPESPFRCGCDIHGWMNAWVGVFKHPLHAVTDDAGRFRIEGVPEGKYVVRFWHEKLGTRDVDVEVKRGEEIAIDSEFTVP